MLRNIVISLQVEKVKILNKQLWVYMNSVKKWIKLCDWYIRYLSCEEKYEIKLFLRHFDIDRYIEMEFKDIKTNNRYDLKSRIIFKDESESLI